MSYAQAVEQQLALMQQLHRPTMARYAREEMGCEESARTYLQHVHDAAELAEPYYWSTEICDVIDGVRHDMPDWTLRREALQSRSGFFWFARPFEAPCPSSEDGAHRDHVVGMLWTIEETLVARGQAVVWIVPVVQEPGDPLSTGRTIPWFFTWTRTHVLDQWPDGGPLHAHNEAVTRIFSACQAFIEQRILVSRSAAVPRATRKRAEQALRHEPLVRVVELRRRQSMPSEHEGPGEPVEWSCRWVVSGHWRRQYYPSTDEHRPVFVLPYIKGPDDRPLKPPRAKVFAVIR